MRLVLFPALLFVFRDLPLPPWERAIIWTLQLGLCIFNLGMVHRRHTLTPTFYVLALGVDRQVNLFAEFS